MTNKRKGSRSSQHKVKRFSGSRGKSLQIKILARTHKRRNINSVKNFTCQKMLSNSVKAGRNAKTHSKLSHASRLSRSRVTLPFVLTIKRRGSTQSGQLSKKMMRVRRSKASKPQSSNSTRKKASHTSTEISTLKEASVDITSCSNQPTS